MRKNFIFCLLVAIISVGLVFSGCSADILSECKNKVSDVRNSYFQGQTNSYFVSFSSGTRESPYVLDGKSGEKVEFGVVTIKPKQSDKEKMLTYIVQIDDKEYSGEFERSPFDDTYAGDIGKEILSSATIYVKINDGETEEIAQLECVSDKFEIDATKALELALAQVQTKVEQIANHKDYEIYIKIVADITQVVPEKYWLVMFLCECGESVSVIINPTNGNCEVKSV